MKRLIIALIPILTSLFVSAAQSDSPLRVFIRAGVKTHGPGQHDHPRFLKDWTQLLAERGAKVDGAMDFPSEKQLEAADVLVMYAAEGGTIKSDQRVHLEKFLKRGGGMVVVHDAVCGTDPHWFKTIVGGAWEHRHSKWYEGEVGIYFLDKEHPITRGVSNFEFKDEIYYDLHMMPGAKVLASSFHSVFDIAPQMWVYEKDQYRAFVCIQGHEYSSFNLPHLRALLLRGIAWAGKRDADLLVSKEELANLKYPEGGPTAPEKAATKIHAPSEFTVRLVASEPLIEKVISMDWDERGRLWVAETPEYPNGRRIHKHDNMVALWREANPQSYQIEVEQRPARDRISILEDTDADGVMDKKSVFFDGLELVTSLVLYHDGVIVTQAPDIYWLRDTNNDGQADKKVVLYTGLGTYDTHAVISNMRWGMDGWIYATLGYSAGHPKSADGTKDFGDVTSGVVRFRPNGSAFEQVSSKGGNTWGLDFAADGELFFTQATSGDHLNHVVLPESVLARGRIGSTASFKPMQDHTKSFPSISHKKQAYVQIDVVGGFTAAAGSCIYTSGAWPAKFDGAHFLSEPTINIVHLDLVKTAAATYIASKDQPEGEFIAGTDPWFRPIHSRVGPDGALYIVDFYNQAVIHNDTRGPKHGAGNAAVRPDRDHHFGRIWRVQHNEAKKVEPPKLTRHNLAGLVKALEHPNGFHRMTAHRLLSGAQNLDALRPLEDLVESNKSDYARVHALWLLHNLGRISSDMLEAALADGSPSLRKNALRIAGENPRTVAPGLKKTILGRLKDADARTRLQAFVALGALPSDRDTVSAVVATYSGLTDPWSQSAAVGTASKTPLPFIEAALAVKDPAGLQSFVGALSEQVGAKQDAALAAKLVVTAAAASASADVLKQTVLEELAGVLKAETMPAWSAELQKAFQTLLASPSSQLVGSAMPLIARWDKKRALTSELKPLIEKLAGRLRDAGLPDSDRAQAAKNLLGVRQLNPEVIATVGEVLGSANSAALQKEIIEALGRTPEPAVGTVLTAAYAKLASELQPLAFNQLVQRSDWAMELLGQVKERKISLAMLGPAAIHRLRTHSDKTVSQRAIACVEEIRGPETKEKDALIGQFASVVQKPGDVENGRQLFLQNCATCHKFNGHGSDLAPELSGMGAHAPVELLTHVLDPNRVVEPNYVAHSIETKDGQLFDGIAVRENLDSLVLRNAQAEMDIKQENIKSRRATGLSLMPDGFESLGGDGLRDLLAFIRAGEGKYRVLDLGAAFTANTSKGIYGSEETANESLRFTRFGVVKVGEVPFEIVTPTKSGTGKNVVVLKGGAGFAKTLPQRVEIKAGVAAKALYFLGGVGGWAWPCCGENKNENVPVAKVTVHYADHEREEITLKNGQEIADYSGRHDVPGSQEALGLVKYGQLRWFRKPLKRQAVIERVALESFDNSVAPTFVSLTAELAEPEIAIAAKSSPVAPSELKTIRALIVGGGSAHDFQRWFNQADTATLNAVENVEATYTEDVKSILPVLNRLQVLYLSHNQPMTNKALRNAIFGFTDSGRGLLLVHAANWYNWRDWPEYNQSLISGGTRSHDKYGEFEVIVENTDHAVMAGVPGTFKITDELYHFQKDAKGPPIQLLATGKNSNTGKTYPVVWIVEHPKARIVCCTLGHDGAAHEHPSFKLILTNALKWAARQN
ncbi:MAG: ThuA domain-containing protein [Verrucomicrobia bacterium]|nr:ThuA domain-containing protein [Verrucomicrobiota bacterium]